jgi:MFS family permease
MQRLRLLAAGNRWKLLTGCPTPDVEALCVMPLLPFARSRIAASPAVGVWQHLDYRRFMLGLGCFYITSWMQRIGVGWLAWELTHSHAWVGAVAAADLAPLVILGPFAGAQADRSDPLRLMRWSQIAFIAQAVALAALTLTGHITIWLLLALSLASGLVQPYYTAARQMIIPASVPRAVFPSAITFDATFFHGSRFIGPMLAALAIPFYGVGSTFLVHVLGCLVFFAKVARMTLTIPPRDTHKASSLLAEIADGLAYTRSHPGIWPLFAMLAVASLVARPLQDLLPGFAGAVFDAGAPGLAWLTSSMGLGSLAAGIYLATRGHVRGLATASIAATFALAVMTFGFVATSRLASGISFAIVWGFALTLMGVGIQAMTQVAVADDMRGRVMILYAMIYRGLPAVGALAIGVIAEHLGIRSTFALAAFVTLIAWLALARRHKSIDDAMNAQRK